MAAPGTEDAAASDSLDGACGSAVLQQTGAPSGAAEKAESSGGETTKTAAASSEHRRRITAVASGRFRSATAASAISSEIETSIETFPFSRCFARAR